MRLRRRIFDGGSVSIVLQAASKLTDTTSVVSEQLVVYADAQDIGAQIR